MNASLFITCLADNLYPNVGESVVRILQRQGVSVDFPDGQTCCGQPAFNSGYGKDAEKVAKHTIQVFENSEYVVLPSGSCTGMIHHYYPEIFKDDPVWRKKADELIERTFELSQFLVKVLKVENVGATLSKKATFHPSCHTTRLLHVKEEPLILLNNVNGLELVDLPYKKDCCGFGGTFAVKMSDISKQMVTEKAQHVQSVAPEILIGSDMGCLMNIGGRMKQLGYPVEVMHIAEVLDQGVTV
ncbi:L-lactate dehydrogenase complex protein LldE [Bacillus ectoiniformans]|uniref:(Fe-S)-binding protein n=1 Tax=Bacillus ectoiniformans TaxID=1494429 RepID=UPI00195BBF84|nr:(Fe-S)-binding protein [Bacillus ectoiniformans]MBM7649600.1 L-lactate dehydrogenase complex protein LldE [Bacillus ectoiniformans]